MKGDFSKWYFDRKNNFNGVLHQQGRVLLDSDWNAQTRITNDWQEIAGKDIIGHDVAAIPADRPDGFKVISAKRGKEVKIEIVPGRAWVDGLPVFLDGDGNTEVTRIATYFNELDANAPNSGNNRDSVILTVWQESANGFQIPNLLMEPALGGPDTTERIHTSMAFGLLKLEDNDTCHNIADKLKDDFSKKGKLTVILKPVQNLGHECPVAEGGGYTGLEHNLYRIEIANVIEDVTDPRPMFKWSQFNGGLVGRGIFDYVNNKVNITENLQAIVASGLSDFYLEVVEFDPVNSLTFGSGCWKVTYGAKVTLNNNELSLATATFIDSLPSSSSPVFFRLWNDIEYIKDFQNLKPTDLLDGIQLKFDAGTNTPQDYWTFSVRAGGITNENTLIDDQPPEGIHYHRVPLAILTWNDNNQVLERIDDCRDIFRPLTNLNICCSFTVGDGKSSHGDYDSIEEALKHIPAPGGEICLLPGLHRTNAILENRKNIKIKGCDIRTVVIPRDSKAPIFRIINSQDITIEHLDIISAGIGAAILMEAAVDNKNLLKSIEVKNNRILAYKSAIHATDGAGINIHHNMIRMLDRDGGDVAIYLMAEDSLIERNEIIVVPDQKIDIKDPGRPNDGNFRPRDPCVKLELLYENDYFIKAYPLAMWGALIHFVPENPFKTTGGIQIGGGSERIKILENNINGGYGNGITLGSLYISAEIKIPENKPVDFVMKSDKINFTVKSEEANELVTTEITFYFNGLNSQILTNDSKGKFILTGQTPATYNVSTSSGYYIIKIEPTKTRTDYFIIVGKIPDVKPPEIAFIYDILIEKNEITNMGLSGIGSALLSNPEGQKESTRLVTVYVPDNVRNSSNLVMTLLQNPIIGLETYRNHIFNCLQNPFDESLSAMSKERGFGGITLGMCENFSAINNNIENNGKSYLYPVCGIFLSEGEHIDIIGNRIINNGIIDKKYDSNLEAGIRGGIVLKVTSFVNTDGIDKELRNYNGRPAARVHENVVDQPAGHAFFMEAFGPVSILDNYFSSAFSAGRATGTQNPSGSAILNAMIRMGGTVCIFNHGIHKIFIKHDIIKNNKKQPTEINADMIHNMISGNDSILPNGNILFNNNQASMGQSNTSYYSQFIFSQDDIGFEGNQSDCLNLNSKGINTYLFGSTLRANDNRFKERSNTQLSLLTLTHLMNITTSNQGDHCILAFNLTRISPINNGNQVLTDIYLNLITCDGINTVYKNGLERNKPYLLSIFA